METREIAKENGVSFEYVYRMLTREVLPRPARKIGTSYLWSPEEAAEARRIISERRARNRRAAPMAA